MKELKTYVYVLIVLFLSMAFISCGIKKLIKYNTPDINDYKIFPSRTLKASASKFQFETCCDSRSRYLFSPLDAKDKKPIGMEEFLKSKSVVAFLVIHKDTVVYERYFDDYCPSSSVPSFSIAKSITATLIGCAIDDGQIKSVEDKITDYVPELKENGFDKVKIKNLLQMTSGIDFKESYFNLTKGMPAYYYSNDLRKKLAKVHLKGEPGKKFEYQSVNTQLLGLVLERAIKPKTISEYLEEKIWQPLGMEYDATWSLDKLNNGMEKTFCCLNTNARDLAKLGRLYLNNGNWNGKQIVSESWISQCTQIDNCSDNFNLYRNSWWIASQKGDFFAHGLLGQFIYVNPQKQVIIVRLGKNTAKVNWVEMFETIANKF